MYVEKGIDPMIRVLLADDRPEVRSALRLLLEQDPQTWRVVGDAADLKSLLELARSISPDVVLLDWELAGLRSPKDGAGAIARLRKLRPNLTVIALSGRSDVCPTALAAGADAFVSKCDPPDGLLGALSQVASQNFGESSHQV
jgi:DNA-binding NarL/FixJ family response regulator